MITLLRNVLALVLGLLAGGLVNMAIVSAGPRIVPPPAGVNMSDAASLRQSAHLLEPKHYAAPFLAHAVGTLVGAAVAGAIAGSRRALLCYLVGGVFLAGGIMAATMIPAPAWFIALDLFGAYLPMAWVAARIVARPPTGAPAIA
jgi:hypothetical protein